MACPAYNEGLPNFSAFSGSCLALHCMHAFVKQSRHTHSLFDLMQLMRFADRALVDGLKQRCSMLLHPHVTTETALPLLAEAMEMDSDRWVQYRPACVLLRSLVLEVSCSTRQPHVSFGMQADGVLYHLCCSAPARACTAAFIFTACG